MEKYNMKHLPLLLFIACWFLCCNWHARFPKWGHLLFNGFGMILFILHEHLLIKKIKKEIKNDN